MRGRSFSALAVSLLLAFACGGGEFAGGGAGGVGGNPAAAGSGLADSGGRNQGGKSASAGAAGSSSSTGGSSAGSLSPDGGSAGEGSGGDSGVAGSSTGHPCTLPSDCQASTKCKQAVCQLGGVCGEQNLPNGPYTLQVSGDCKRLECSDGKEVIVSDAADADDKNECTTDSCGAAGGAVHTPRSGEPCLAGTGLCSATGKCEPVQP